MSKTLLRATAGLGLVAGLAGHAGAAEAGQPWWLTPVSLTQAPQPAHKRPKAIPVQANGDDPAQPQQAAVADPPPEPEKPGVLTREGVLVIEPSVEYQHSNVNKFVVGGVAILDTALIGTIQASQADRDSVTATLGLRYGITNRLEAELRVPFMYRHDQTTNTFVSTNNVAATNSLTDEDLGDIEGALHYQINDGEGGWPFFVANLRVKSATGRGPFDVKRDFNGVEQELATGSGSWGIEPSLTVIAPSDPAVFYANLGYLYNFSENVDKDITSSQHLNSVDPGGAVRLGVGMGISLNEKVSFSIGYQEDFISGTTTNFNTGSFKSGSLNVGSMTFGVNWQMTPDTALNVNVGVGVTRDAPDMRLMVRVPVALKLF
ncbi:MAG: transporter [Actinomycetota bacterium]